MRIIGLSGGIGSGKTTVSSYLSKKHDFTTLSTRKMLTEVLLANGVSTDRSELQNVGRRLIECVHASGFLALMLAFLPEGDYTIDAIRYSDGIDYLRRKYPSHFLHLHLMCEDTLRKSRLQVKGYHNDAVNLERIEQAETEIENDKLSKVADYVILNDGTEEQLYSQIEDALHRFGV